MKRIVVLTALVLAACSGGQDPTGDDSPRGVTDDEIVIGSHTDLSGGLAIWGVPLTNGQRMRYDEVNANGGVHGRKIRLIVEDSQYQMPIAVKAANKLLNVDDIFLMVGSMGTPMNIAIMPKMFEANVPNLFPLTAAVQMHEPLHPMKFNYFVSYRDQIRGGMAYMVDKHGFKNVCLQALANDYGHENEIGFEQAVEELGLEVAYAGQHKAAETDFVGTITAIKNSGCEMLVLGPLVKDTILIYSAARDAGSGQRCVFRRPCSKPGRPYRARPGFQPAGRVRFPDPARAKRSRRGSSSCRRWDHPDNAGLQPSKATPGP